MRAFEYHALAPRKPFDRDRFERHERAKSELREAAKRLLTALPRPALTVPRRAFTSVWSSKRRRVYFLNL